MLYCYVMDFPFIFSLVSLRFSLFSISPEIP